MVDVKVGALLPRILSIAAGTRFPVMLDKDLKVLPHRAKRPNDDVRANPASLGNVSAGVGEPNVAGIVNRPPGELLAGRLDDAVSIRNPLGTGQDARGSQNPQNSRKSMQPHADFITTS